MTILLTIIHIFVCLFLIGVVLLQSGRAGGMGVLSGAATQTVFGGRGAGGFLQKVTAGSAIVFMLTCSALAYIASSTRDRGLRNSAASTTSTAAPAHAPASTSHSGASGTSSGSSAPVPSAPPAPSAPAPAAPEAPAAPAPANPPGSN